MEVDASPGKQSNKKAKKFLSKEQETYKGGWEDTAWKKKTANQEITTKRGVQLG